MKLIPSIPKPAWAAGLKVVTCRCEACHKILAVRHFSARKAGIRLCEAWYCSARCFTAAAEREISRLLKSARDQANHVSRMPLGLNLISHGLLTVEQLKKATEEQKETGLEIGDLLVRSGSVTEKQVTAIRAADWGCPVFTVPRHPARIGVSVPYTLIRCYSMIPVHYVASQNLLLVGFVHTVEYGLLYAIEQMTKCQTKPCFVTPNDFEIQLQHSERAHKSGDISARELNFEGPHSAAEIAETLCSHGLEIEADEASMEMSKNYLWARLRCEAASIDLLFRTS
jgi:Type II secretion system (T2SS), protein E, N-terminal domain